jgi:hypothetical protein
MGDDIKRYEVLEVLAASAGIVHTPQVRSPTLDGVPDLATPFAG